MLVIFCISMHIYDYLSGISIPGLNEKKKDNGIILYWLKI